MSRAFATLLVVSVTLAGCSVALPAGRSPTQSDTTTPAPVPTATATPTPERLAPGLTTAGVGNPAALVRAHVDAYTTSRYTVLFSERRVRAGATAISYSGLARIDESCGSYSIGVYQPRPAPPRLTQWYANGTVALSRSFTANLSGTDPGVGFTDPAPRVVRVDGTPADPCAVRPFDPTFAATLHTLYDTLAFSVLAAEDRTRLTTSNGTVATLPMLGVSGEAVRNATVKEVEVTLDPDGAVTAVEFRYTGETDEGRVKGRVSVRYEELTEPVDPPWPAGATER